MKKLYRILSQSLFVVFFMFLFFSLSKEIWAAPFTQATVRYDRMKASTPTSLQVIIVPTTVGTEAKIKIIFGSAVVGANSTVVTVTNVGTASTLPGTLTAARVGTSQIDISGVADLTVGTTYAFNIGQGVSTPAAGTAFDIVRSTTAGDATIDQTTVASRYITDDQVVITANVPPTFTFALTGNTDVFTGDLTSGSVVSTLGIGVSVSTNAAKGWTGWIKSANIALSSATTGETIPTTGTVNNSPDTCSPGTDCYVLDVGVTAGTGTGTLAAADEYAGNGTTSGGTLSSVFQPFALRTGKTINDTVWLKARVAMIATKAAGSDYTDTWTIVGAGNF